MCGGAAMFLILLICVSFEGHAVYGLSQIQNTEVKIVANTLRVEPTVTPALNLRCALYPTHKPTNVDFDHIFGIQMLRNSELIASVSMYRAAAPVGQMYSNLNVTGSVGEAFLELVWSNPGADTIGEYTCSVGGIDNGFQTKSESSLQILEQGMSDDKIAETVKSLAAELHILKNENVDLKKQMKRENVDLKKEMKRENVYLKKEMKRENVDLKKEMKRASHIESGRVGHWGAVGKGNSKQSFTMSVNFKHAYETTPKVTTAVNRIAMEFSDYHDYTVTVYNVNRNGFRVRVNVYSKSFRLWSIALTWISFPQ